MEEKWGPKEGKSGARRGAERRQKRTRLFGAGLCDQEFD